MNLVPSAARGIARDTTWILAGRLVAQGLLVLATVVLARRLGLVGFAGYAILVAVVALGNVGTTFGTDLVLIREIAGGGRLGRWRSGLAVQLGLSFAAIAVAWLVAPILPWPAPDGQEALRIFALALLPMAVANIGTAVLRGCSAMGPYAIVGVLGAAVQLGAVVLFVPDGGSLTTVAWALLGVQVVGAAATWAMAAVVAPDLLHLRGADWRPAAVAEMARTSVPIGVLGLLGVLYQRAPVLVLAAATGPAGTAWFAAASRVAEGAKTGHVALLNAAFPVMSSSNRAGEGGSRERAAALQWSWRVTVVVAVLLAVALALLTPVVIAVLYGPTFAPATPALAILAAAVVPATAATYRALAFLAVHREPVVFRALLLGLVLLGGVLAVLLPTIGWIGAAWAVLVAETGQLVALLAADRGHRAETTAPTRAWRPASLPETPTAR